ncbi:MAG: 1-acyl-sn-glycerol-3-phosphate acyltransferase [Chlamydiia bacterium]|nr:1-acyl-sn-glycerol-3-phosphate acyltransferase [Chlamydiia bacterium]
MDYRSLLQKAQDELGLPSVQASVLDGFIDHWLSALKASGRDPAGAQELIERHIRLVAEQCVCPYRFAPFHQKLRAPHDFYSLALQWVDPMIDWERSTIEGEDRLDGLVQAVRRGENVIFLSNHQTEPDPQILCLMLGQKYPDLAEDIIFVAGHRVTHDPLSIPFSMGHDLICIYSKRYIEHPPEEKAEKQEHNRRTMRRLGELLAEGGKMIWVAPSGGRDRPDSEGNVQIAPFDPQAVEMFGLMARQSRVPAHFCTLAMWTYDLLPPPASVEVQIGEPRLPSYGPVHLCFGPDIPEDAIAFPEIADKKERRRMRAEALWQMVCEDYARIVAHAGYPLTPHKKH